MIYKRKINVNEEEVMAAATYGHFEIVLNIYIEQGEAIK